MPHAPSWLPFPADAGSDDGDSSSVGAGDLAVPPSPTAPAAEEVMVGEGMRGAQVRGERRGEGAW